MQATTYTKGTTIVTIEPTSNGAFRRSVTLDGELVKAFGNDHLTLQSASTEDVEYRARGYTAKLVA